IAFAGNDLVPANQDVLVYDLVTKSTRRVLSGDANYFSIAWSPDGEALTVIDAISNSDTNVYLVAPTTGAVRLLTPHDDEALFFPHAWTPAGDGFFLLTDEGREFVGLALFDLETGTYQWLETPDWDITAAEASCDGRILAW